MNVSLSVALVTRNRVLSLRRTLESLRAQHTQPTEVVISDDSDETEQREVEALARQFECRYVSGPRRGLYANRNHAIHECRGSHVRNMDDDHEFPHGHIDACFEAIENDASSIWIIGEFLPSEDPQSHPVLCPGEWQPRGFSSHPPDPDHCWAMADGAVIFPRSVFESGNLYSEAFRFGYAYVELGSRLHWLGYRIRQLRKTYVIHHYDSSNRSVMCEATNCASRYFAMLCHSFVYQRSIGNQALSTAQILYELTVKRPRLARQALPRAFHEFRRHKARVEAIAERVQAERR